VTTTCQRRSAYRFGRNLLVVDTPGVFDTKSPQEEILKQLTKCVGISAPGPYAFALVIEANRFTEESLKSVELLEKLFGEELYQYLIVLFTRVDDMG